MTIKSLLKFLILTLAYISCAEPNENNGKSGIKSPKKIFVFDFDLTLTKQHTGGTPISGNSQMSDNDIFGTKKQQLEELFKKINAANHKIYINTRGVAKEVEQVLKRDINLMQYIDKVYGAKSRNHLAKGEDYWSKKKVEYLKEIKHDNPNDDIYFFDDTKLNCTEAEAQNGLCSKVHHIKQQNNTKDNIDITINLVKNILNNG